MVDLMTNTALLDVARDTVEIREHYEWLEVTG
jgi:hypothetical protein